MIIKKKKIKHDKMVFLTKAIKISRDLINSYVGYNEYFPINVLREYDDMKKVIKNLKTLTVH